MKEQMERLLEKCDEIGLIDYRDEDELFEEVSVYKDSDQMTENTRSLRTPKSNDAGSKRSLDSRSISQTLFMPKFAGMEEDPTCAPTIMPHLSQRPSTQSDVTSSTDEKIEPKSNDTDVESANVCPVDEEKERRRRGKSCCMYFYMYS
jgi:hypothetical protein